MTEINAILTALAGAPQEAGALATLVTVAGSSYRRVGARLLLLGNGLRLGTVSGGCLEDDVVARAQEVLQNGRPQILVYDTRRDEDLVWGVGTGCHGVVQVFIELIPIQRPPWLMVLAANLAARRPTALSIVYGETAGKFRGTHLVEELPSSIAAAEALREIIEPPPSLVIFGAGDDARPLVRMAKEIGWRIAVVDSRSGYATAARFPAADEVIVAARGELPPQLAWDAETFVVLMTHRFTEDRDLLRALLTRPLAYLGVLGPRLRTQNLLAEITREGGVVAPEMLARLYAPVGLDLGSSTPEAVALSVLAEMQCRRHGRAPMHLRDRTGPIHG